MSGLLIVAAALIYLPWIVAMYLWGAYHPWPFLVRMLGFLSIIAATGCLVVAALMQSNGK
jgi:hypothetical protein